VGAIVFGAILAIAFVLGSMAIVPIIQERLFFAPYRREAPRERAGEASRTARWLSSVHVIIAIGGGRSAARAQREADQMRILHEPLVDPNLERRRVLAWLVEPAWVVLAMVGGIIIFVLATTFSA
jgi:hypothetical protein